MKMNQAIIVAAGGLVVATVAIGQMGMGNGMGGMRGPGMMGNADRGVSFQRHMYVMTNGIDPSYKAYHNPLVANDKNLKAGKAIFEQNCVTCHGTSGRGDGPAAKGLTPAPANLSAAVKMPIANDAYLAWTISEGGVPVHSAMPPFKTVLASDQIWKLVLYLRTL